MKYPEKFLDELSEDLMGSMAMDSVVLDRINWTCDKYKLKHFFTYSDALELLEKERMEIAECPVCGWISEGNFYEHPEYDGVCSDCEEEDEQ